MVETELIGVFQDDHGVDLHVLCKAERKDRLEWEYSISFETPFDRRYELESYV
jgi:hypothetical protein